MRSGCARWSSSRQRVKIEARARLRFSVRVDHLEVKPRRFPHGMRMAVAQLLFLAATFSVTAEEAPLWSLQPVKEQAAPAVQNTQWPAGRIDHFILAELEKSSLPPNADA